jgi:hypothetical protein
MAFGARQPALGGPAAVAVHDDCNVANGGSPGRLPSKLIGRKCHVRLLHMKENAMS